MLTQRPKQPLRSSRKLVDHARVPIDPRPHGLTEDLPEITPEGWALVDNVDVASALGRLGLTGLDLEEATTAATKVLSSKSSRGLIAGLATEAVGTWESITPVRYFPDGDADRQSFILATLAVLQPLAEASLEKFGVSKQVTTKTLHSTGTQVRLFRAHTGRLGVLSGWWQLYGLCGGYVEVVELHAHRIELGTHQLGPDPWLAESHQHARGDGFFEGDEAIGLHIPHGADLSVEALLATFEVLRDEVQRRWPTTKRRVLSIQTWMLDRQLREHLGPDSRIVTFQSLFEPLDLHAPNDELTRRLVFGGEETPANPTRLQRVLEQLWSEGKPSRWEVGIRLLDAPRPLGK